MIGDSCSLDLGFLPYADSLRLDCESGVLILLLEIAVWVWVASLAWVDVMEWRMDVGEA